MSKINWGKKERLSDRVVRFILCLNMEELGKLTKEKIAQVFEVEIAYLLEQFKKQKSITLQRYIIREKIHRAFFKLETNQSDSIESISNRLGFRRIDEFELEFKNYLYIPPKKFKELRNR